MINSYPPAPTERQTASALQRVLRLPGAQPGYGRAETGLTLLWAALLYCSLAAVVDQTLLRQAWPLAVCSMALAFVLGSLMASSRFDWLFAVAYSLFVGLAWVIGGLTPMITPTEIAELGLQGQAPALARSGVLLTAANHWWLAGELLPTRTQELVWGAGVILALWWLTYLGTWAILRQGASWLSVFSAGLALAFCCQWGEPPLLGWLALFCAAAFLLLCQTHLRERQLHWRTRQIAVQPTLNRHFLVTALGFALTALLSAGLMPALGQSSWVHQQIGQWPWLNPTFCWPGRCAISGNFAAELLLTGPRLVDDTPVLRIATSGKRYWRALIFDTYAGRRWSSDTLGAQAFAAATPLPGQQWSPTVELTQTVTVLQPGQQAIVGAAEIHRVSLPVDAQLQQADPPAGLAVRTLQAQRPLERNEQYTVVSQLPVATAAELAAAGTDYPPTVRALYLQLPENFSPRIAATALTVTQAAITPYAKVRAVESFLRRYPYNDQLQAPPVGVDPVEYFLYTAQSGYCDYYASAMVLLVRSLGIPARLASGYAQGVWEESTGAYVVRRRDAHSWVEVFFPTVGWVEFEPTANQPANTASTAQPPAATAPEPLSVAGNTLAAPPNAVSKTVDQERSLLWDLLSQHAGRDFGYGLLLLLLAGTLWVSGIQYWRQRRQPDAELPIDLYLRMLRWAKRLGIPLRPSDTPYEQARRLVQIVPAGRMLIQTLIDGYVYLLFRRKAATGATLTPNNPAPANLLHSWRQLQPVLWKAWVQRSTRFLWQRKNQFQLS